MKHRVTQHTEQPLWDGGACLLKELLTAQICMLHTFSLSNLAECTPTTHTGWPAYLRSSAASSGSTCMQLMQQYVQKSSTSTFPFSSLQALRKNHLLTQNVLHVWVGPCHHSLIEDGSQVSSMAWQPPQHSLPPGQMMKIDEYQKEGSRAQDPPGQPQGR